MHRRALIATTALLVCRPAAAAAAFTNAGIVLLQPEDVLRSRVPDANALARYIKDVEATTGKVLEAAFQRKPNGAYLVMALRPGGRSKAWLDLEAPLPQATHDALQAALEALPPPGVVGGVVVLAIKASLWGGRPPTKPGPAPQAWREQAARSARKLEVGELVDALWPD
jgi:hypothetical protein